MAVTGEPLDTVAGAVRAEIEVTRSRFICDLVPVVDTDEAAEVVASARREFHDARHHCSAWILGPPGDVTRSSDDGEPSGTAGAPMLAVLQGAQLTEVVAVVTRYFGGTLLGAGGLVRAYGDAVRAVLADVVRVSRRALQVVDLEVSHADAGRLEHRVRLWATDLGAEVGAPRYEASGASFEVAVPPTALEHLEAQLAASGIDHTLIDHGQHVRRVPR